MTQVLSLRVGLIFNVSESFQEEAQENNSPTKIVHSGFINFYVFKAKSEQKATKKYLVDKVHYKSDSKTIFM